MHFPVLLAQPFSPALFRQGKQPWAAFLLDTLRWDVAWPEDEVRHLEGQRKLWHMVEEVADAEQRSKKTHLLKDMIWPCAYCPSGEPLGYNKFMASDETWTPQTHDDFRAWTTEPGVGRRCLVCRGEGPAEATLECIRCGMLPVVRSSSATYTTRRIHSC